MNHKSEVYETFKVWKAEVHNQLGKKIKSINYDNGGEFELKAYRKHCQEHGIILLRTIPGKPRQNGVAERMHKTLLEMARSMTVHVGLPKCFWADVVSTVT